MVNNESNEYKINLQNKDLIIEQLKNQIEEIENEIQQKENDIIIYEQSKKNDIIEFTQKINDLIKDKALLESEKKEISDSLIMATETIKKLQEYIKNKIHTLQQQLFKENAKKMK